MKSSCKMVAILLCIATYAFADYLDNEIRLLESKDSDGTRYVYAISKDMAASIPQWDPIKENPPLSINKAIIIAKTWWHKTYPKSQNFNIWDITLSRLPSPEYRDKWHYRISIFPTSDNSDIKPSCPTIIVLMDGKVVSWVNDNTIK